MDDHEPIYIDDPPTRPTLTHFVRDDEPEDRWRRARAFCGQRVHVIREVSGEPTCPRCAARLVDYEAQVGP